MPNPPKRSEESAATVLGRWKIAERESIEEAIQYQSESELTNGEIMGRFFEVRILDYKGLDKVRESLGLDPYFKWIESKE